MPTTFRIGISGKNTQSFYACSLAPCVRSTTVLVLVHPFVTMSNGRKCPIHQNQKKFISKLAFSLKITISILVTLNLIKTGPMCVLVPFSYSKKKVYWRKGDAETLKLFMVSFSLDDVSTKNAI